MNFGAGAFISIPLVLLASGHGFGSGSRNQHQVHSPRRSEAIAIRPIDGDTQHGKRASVAAPLVIYDGA
jgi:hypothetical protein